MSFSAGPIFTNAGRALHARAVAGATLNFTKIQMGDGTLGSQQIANLTSLISPVAAVNISTMKATGEYVKISGTFSNTDIQTGFYWKEIGLWAADPDYPTDRTKDILYCYQNAGILADYIPAAGSELISKRITIAAVVSNVTTITATLTQASSADSVSFDNTGTDLSATDVQEAIEELDERTENVAIANGGTGATTAAGARTNLQAQQITDALTEEATLSDADSVPFFDYSAGAHRKTLWSTIKSTLKTYFDTLYAASSHNHSASNITSGTLPIGRGGTGFTTAAEALASLYGISSQATRINAGGNLNNATTVGLYIYSGADSTSISNAPEIAQTTVIVLPRLLNYASSPENLVQIATTSNNRVFIRHLSENTWGAWYEMYGSGGSADVPISKGGTGAKTAAQALLNLGAQAALGFTPIQQGGGTGQANNKVKIGWSGSTTTGLKVMVDNLDLGALVFAGSADTVLLPITKGGTGANNAATARTNLGVPSNDSFRAVEKYNGMAANKTISTSDAVTVSPIPNGGWTPITAGTNYKNGDYEIFGSGYYNSGYDVTRAFDNNMSSGWISSSGTTHHIGVKLPTALTVRKIKWALTGTATVKVQGSNNGTAWTDLYTENVSTTYATLTEVTITSPGSYSYYRLHFTTSSPATVSVFEFQLSDYTVPSYTMGYTASGVPATWSNNQIIMVETPAADTVGVTSNTVNGIVVDTILKPLTKYELIYNANKFYALEVA